jgi:hypothetical protein
LAGGSTQLRQGSIVWIEVPDTRGHVKRRPVVVVTATDEMLLDEPIVGVAVTTTFPDPPNQWQIPLPWWDHGHPATRLRRRSAAVCNWLVKFRHSDVQSVEGYVPGVTLAKVLRIVARLGDAPTESDG